MEKKIKHFFLCIQDPVENLPTGELRCIICSVKMNSRECANAHIMGTPAYSTISNLVRVLLVLVSRTTVLPTDTVYYWYLVLVVGAQGL
jgi:hypothetical protein